MGSNIIDGILFQDIKDYEGLYSINYLGEVMRNGKILKQRDNGCGYFQVTLCKKGIRKTITIHKLVCETFIKKNNMNFTDIDHIDMNKYNNCVSNLRYIDKSGNNRNTIRFNKTGYRGVKQRKNKFYSYIRINGKKTYLGKFNTPIEANEAYEKSFKDIMSIY